MGRPFHNVLPFISRGSVAFQSTCIPSANLTFPLILYVRSRCNLLLFSCASDYPVHSLLSPRCVKFGYCPLWRSAIGAPHSSVPECLTLSEFPFQTVLFLDHHQYGPCSLLSQLRTFCRSITYFVASRYVVSILPRLFVDFHRDLHFLTAGFRLIRLGHCLS